MNSGSDLIPDSSGTEISIKRRGMKIIVVDPRRTETAKYADIHLQPKPGFDAEIASAMLKLILQNNWHDQVFCD
mgnify:CR=1 FL=1